VVLTLLAAARQAGRWREPYVTQGRQCPAGDVGREGGGERRLGLLEGQEPGGEVPALGLGEPGADVGGGQRAERCMDHTIRYTNFNLLDGSGTHLAEGSLVEFSPEAERWEIRYPRDSIIRMIS
jgi:hypothetical protein